METTQTATQEQLTQDLTKGQYVVEIWDNLVSSVKTRIKILKGKLNALNALRPLPDDEGVNEVSLELSRLEKELFMETTSLHHKRGALKGLQNHADRHKKILEDETKETNDNFDELIAKAKTKLHNKDVSNLLRLFDTSKLEILKDQVSKNKFYNDLKIHVK